MGLSNSVTDDPRADQSITSLRRAGDVGALAGALCFVVVVTRFFSAPFGRSFGSNFYDVQAIQLLHGHLAMPPAVVSVEGIPHAGQMYMYFGPFLALMRLPIMAIAPNIAGQLSQLSMTIGYLVLMVAVTRLVLALRAMRTNVEPRRGERAAMFAFTFFAGTGTVVLFLAGRPSIYDETELWGAALTVWFLVLALRWLGAPTSRRLWGLVLIAVCVTLTRASVALGPLMLLGGCAVIAGARPDGPIHRWFRGFATTRSRRDVVVLASGVVVAIGAYATINYLKFGTLFSLPLNTQVLATNGLDPQLHAFAATHSSFFSLSYLPTTLSWYLRPDTLHASSLFAFVGFTNHIDVVGGVSFAELTPASSVTASMTWLAVLALVSCALWWRRRSHTERDGRVAVLICAGIVSTIGVLLYAVIAHRYLADALPLLFVAGALGLLALFDHAQSFRPWLRWFTIGVVTVSALWSMLANGALGLQNAYVIRSDIEPSARTSYIAFQQSLYHHLVGPHAPGTTFGFVPPLAPQIGDLFVLGTCAGVYQFDSANWTPVELGRRGGHIVATVTFPTTTHGFEALMSSGSTARSQDIWAVERVATDTFVLAYSSRAFARFFGLPTWVRSAPFTIAPGSRHVLDLIIAAGGPPATRFASARIDGTTALAVPYAVSPSLHFHVGTAAGVMPFTGSLIEQPTPVPLCHRLRS